MNYEKMIAVNRIESEQKIKLATMAIEQLIERGEYPSVTLLVKKLAYQEGSFIKSRSEKQVGCSRAIAQCIMSKNLE